MEQLIKKVKQWSIERNIHKARPEEQTLKLIEEVGELASGLLKSNDDLVIDSLGDILVVLIILHQQLGLTIEQTLNVAYNEIKDRKGKTIGGVFIKENDL